VLPRSMAMASSALSKARLTPRNLASGRNVIEGDLACVGNGAHSKDVAVLDCDEERIVRLPNPRHKDLRRLIAQPPLQDSLVVPMIRDAQLRYRPPHYLAGGCCIFRGGGPNF